jgi:hypothetical protein
MRVDDVARKGIFEMRGLMTVSNQKVPINGSACAAARGKKDLNPLP